MRLEEVHRAGGTSWSEVPGGRAPAHHGDPAAEFEAARCAAGLVDRCHSGRLRIGGAQRLSYLQRISAQDFDGLAPPRGVRAAILERRGKIIEVITAHALEDHLLALTSATLRQEASGWIRRFIFRDDVQVEDITEGTGQLLLVGPRSAEVIAGWAGDGAAGLTPHGWAAHPERPDCIVIRDGFAAWEAFHVVGPREVMGDVWVDLLQSGGARGLRAAGQQAYQALRVLCGVPEGGSEMDARSNPMELGLHDAYSLSKGCYTGQEVLAKMDTHHSVKRSLVGLELSGEGLPDGDALLYGGGKVGRITSAARVPGCGRAVALALVAHEHAAAGVTLGVEGGPQAQVTALPFPE
jgi:folate-binding protein YgfZ